jgi:exodeoxyribonuclease III
MKIATWNVNSVRARWERLTAWLEASQPDILCLQELKVRQEHFPFDLLEDLGYGAAVLGQKTYNGVAILSRATPRDVREGLGDEVDDPQARLISAEVADVRVLSAYVPNGKEVGDEKYGYKLRWLARLLEHLERHHDPGEPLVLAGDFNVARAALDVHDEAAWQGSVLYNPELIAALDRLLDWGLVDVWREHNPDTCAYSWWDYRGGAFRRDHGLRIDYLLATRPVTERVSAAWIDREAREGKRPSDHAPVLIEVGDGPGGRRGAR